ncbi:hypothetical protein, partial [Geobacter sp. OR-1]|uniref:hypothetical protein n=1 Tax=Geobacter sp. OR-1 TaxID=1266765 RepID=UPI0005A9B658
MRVIIYVVAALGLLFTDVYADTFDCNLVSAVKHNSNYYKKVSTAMNKMVGKYDKSIKVDKITLLYAKNDWFIADCTFNKVDGGIFVLHINNKKIEVVEELSGNIRGDSEQELSDIIYDYFTKNIHDVPKDLIYCSSKKIAKNWE